MKMCKVFILSMEIDIFSMHIWKIDIFAVFSPMILKKCQCIHQELATKIIEIAMNIKLLSPFSHSLKGSSLSGGSLVGYQTCNAKNERILQIAFWCTWYLFLSVYVVVLYCPFAYILFGAPSPDRWYFVLGLDKM